MSREIKFRAWDKVSKTMIGFDELILAPVTLSKLIKGERKRSGVLMQFTGLRDVNGVDIYEGDIISGSSKVFKETCGEVKFSSYLDNEEYMHQYHLGWHVNGIPLQDLVNDGLVVTGNVFKHPHLLDGAK